MTEPTTPEPQLNRAGRRAEGRRLRKTGAVMAAIPVAFGTTALAVGATAGTAGAADRLVTNLDPSGPGSLHDVAEAAGNDDVITFQAGLSGTITLADDIDITASVTIIGPGRDVVTVSGNDAVRIFDIAGAGGDATSVVISGLTLTRGLGDDDGGAIRLAQADLTLADAAITDSATDDLVNDGGGAIAVSYADGPEDDDIDLRIERSILTGNSGRWGGAIYFYSDGGSVTIVDSEISRNTATTGGGGAAWIGGGEEDGTPGNEVRVDISGSTFADNTATEDDGAALFLEVSGAFTITDSTFSGNDALSGGGGAFRAENALGGVAITGSTFSDNTATDYGGAIYITDSADSTISFTTIADNSSTGSGGGIEWYSNSGSLLIESSTLSGNTADVKGGAIYAGRNEAVVTIANSTISGNTATERGGAINFYGYFGLEILQSTITGNEAAEIGGVWISDPTVDSDSAAVREQAADAPGAPDDAEPPSRPAADTVVQPVVVSGSIIQGNANGDIGTQSTVQATGSLLGTIVGTTLVDGGDNLQGVDPLLGPLQDNGGPTQTHALLDGSPAINAGPDPVADFPGNTDDQRGPGYPRVVGGRVDIGAFEVQPTNIEPTFTG